MLPSTIREHLRRTRWCEAFSVPTLMPMSPLPLCLFPLPFAVGREVWTTEMPLNISAESPIPERFMTQTFAPVTDLIGIRLPISALAVLISPAPRFPRHPERYASVHLKALKPKPAFAALSPNHATSNFSAKGILRLKPAKSERRNAAESLKTPKKSVERRPPPQKCAVNFRY